MVEETLYWLLSEADPILAFIFGVNLGLLGRRGVLRGLQVVQRRREGRRGCGENNG